MRGKIITLFLTAVLAVAVVNSNDLRLGSVHANSRKIFSEVTEVAPAIWRRSEQLTINATGNEVISGIFITDLRQEKDGEAYIESGGVGTRSVVITLKSPAVFRGYTFDVEVYAQYPTERFYNKGGVQPNYADNTQYGQFARKY